MKTWTQVTLDGSASDVKYCPYLRVWAGGEVACSQMFWLWKRPRTSVTRALIKEDAMTLCVIHKKTGNVCNYSFIPRFTFYRAKIGIHMQMLEGDEPPCSHDSYGHY